MRRRFSNLRIPEEANRTRWAEIVVEDGRISAVEPAGAGPDGRRPTGGEDRDPAVRIDLGGALVLPGVIDGHVHFDDPGFTHREDFASGTGRPPPAGCHLRRRHALHLAAAGDLGRQPPQQAPRHPAQGPRRLHALGRGLRQRDGRAPTGASDLAELVADGVASIKVYTLSGMDTFRDLGHDQLREVLRETERLGVPVGVHAEDRRAGARAHRSPAGRGEERPPRLRRLPAGGGRGHRRSRCAELCPRDRRPGPHRPPRQRRGPRPHQPRRGATGCRCRGRPAPTSSSSPPRIWRDRARCSRPRRWSSRRPTASACGGASPPASSTSSPPTTPPASGPRRSTPDRSGPTTAASPGSSSCCPTSTPRGFDRPHHPRAAGRDHRRRPGPLLRRR